MRSQIVIPFCMLLLLSAPVVHGARSTVAVLGEQAPGAPAGVTYRGFYDGVLNNSGKATFNGYFQGPGITASTERGLWSNGFGTLELVARAGTNAPGTPAGVTFSNFINPSISRTGATFFYGSLTGAGVTSANDQGYWTNRSGSLELIAREGGQVPGMPDGVVFTSLPPFTYVNRAGHAAFQSSLSGTGVTATNNGGLWVLGDAGLALVARKGDQAPGLSNGITFASMGAHGFNDIGQFAVAAALAGDGVTAANDSTIWRIAAGQSTLVIREGEQLPGLPAGIQYGGLAGQGPLAFNNAGSVAAIAQLTGSGVTTANDVGIWVDRPGGPALIAREGDQPPGAPLGTRFTLFANAKINSGGRVVFAAAIDVPGVNGSIRAGIWSEGPNGLTLVALEDELAPGGFDGNDAFVSLSTSPSINAAGQVAFSARSTYRDPRGIWATDVSGQLHLISVGLSPDFSGNSGNEDGHLVAFNDRGEIIFGVASGLYTGVHVEDAVAILSGDYDRDGVVASSDLDVWRSALGHVGTIHAADGDLDGDVDGDDLLLWQRQLGVGASSTLTSAFVPEPAGILMVAAAVTALVRRRR